MCEIAVVDPEEASLQVIQQLAGQFYREQGDPGTVKTLLDETEITEGQKKTTEERHELIIEKVAET